MPFGKNRRPGYCIAAVVGAAIGLALWCFTTYIISEEDSKMPGELRVALEKATQFELLSLNPEWPEQVPPDSFHGYKILGKTTVNDAVVRKKLVTAFKKAVSESGKGAPGCFNPRHGIRVTYKGQMVDFVICFECIQVKAYIPDEPVKGFLVRGDPAVTFDDVLREAKLPLAEKPKKR
jgi:hypothetical protein